MSHSNETFQKTRKTRDSQAYGALQEVRIRKGKRQQENRKVAQREHQEGR